ncbi:MULTISPECIES: CBO0543 family protein [Bacillus]|uniref:CBO0543 family protein n=1 Tax=Bacillus TaxID=1386 RepID=UPI000BB8D52A|nr:MULTISPECIES: CBO0543 family protein [Bacillus]
MNIEFMLLYVLYAITFISLGFIPKNKWREASIAFSFQQFVTWFLGLLVVQLNLIEYPVRELANVNGTSFLFEFIMFPIISSFFCIYYPQKKTIWKKFVYISSFCTILTLLEILFEKYTNLINYLHWDWYVTWITVFGSLILIWKFYKWFFQLK